MRRSPRPSLRVGDGAFSISPLVSAAEQGSMLPHVAAGGSPVDGSQAFMRAVQDAEDSLRRSPRPSLRSDDDGEFSIPPLTSAAGEDQKPRWLHVTGYREQWFEAMCPTCGNDCGGMCALTASLNPVPLPPLVGALPTDSAQSGVPTAIGCPAATGSVGSTSDVTADASIPASHLRSAASARDAAWNTAVPGLPPLGPWGRGEQGLADAEAALKTWASCGGCSAGTFRLRCARGTRDAVTKGALRYLRGKRRYLQCVQCEHRTSDAIERVSYKTSLRPADACRFQIVIEECKEGVVVVGCIPHSSDAQHSHRLGPLPGDNVNPYALGAPPVQIPDHLLAEAKELNKSGVIPLQLIDSHLRLKFSDTAACWTRDQLRNALQAGGTQVARDEDTLRDFFVSLSERNLPYDTSSYDNGYTATIVCAIEENLSVWTQGGRVLSLDTTWGTNQYGYKMMLYVTTDYQRRTRILAVAMLAAETQNLFEHCHRQFTSMFGDVHPSTFFTDDDSHLIASCTATWPEASPFLCVFHLSLTLNSLLSKCRTSNGSDERKMVTDAWWDVILRTDVRSKQTFDADVKSLRDQVVEWQPPAAVSDVIGFFEKLKQRKEQCAYRFTWSVFTSGVNATTRSEMVHGQIKQKGVHKRGNLCTALRTVRQLATDFKNRSDALESRRDVKRSALVKPLEGKISESALRLLDHQFARVLDYDATVVEDGKCLVVYAAHIRSNAAVADTAAATAADLSPCGVEVGPCDEEVEGTASGAPRDLSLSGYLTGPKDCSCQYLNKFGIPCRHMMRVWLLGSFDEVDVLSLIHKQYHLQQYQLQSSDTSAAPTGPSAGAECAAGADGAAAAVCRPPCVRRTVPTSSRLHGSVMASCTTERERAGHLQRAFKPLLDLAAATPTRAAWLNAQLERLHQEVLTSSSRGLGKKQHKTAAAKPPRPAMSSPGAAPGASGNNAPREITVLSRSLGPQSEVRDLKLAGLGLGATKLGCIHDALVVLAREKGAQANLRYFADATDKLLVSVCEQMQSVKNTAVCKQPPKYAVVHSLRTAVKDFLDRTIVRSSSSAPPAPSDSAAVTQEDGVPAPTDTPTVHLPTSPRGSKRKRRMPNVGERVPQRSRRGGRTAKGKRRNDH